MYRSNDINIGKKCVKTPMDYENEIKKSIQDSDKQFLGFVSLEWQGRVSKVILYCPNHGNFSIAISSILRGSTCKKCGYVSTKEKQTKSTEKFISELNILYQDSLDYRNIVYINDSTKVILKCIQHNHSYESTPTHLLQGKRGCKMCKSFSLKEHFKSNTEDFIKKCIELKIDEKIDLSTAVYIRSNKKLEVSCKKCGCKLKMTPNSILSGNGCIYCQQNGYQISKPGTLYIQKLESDAGRFIKFGITNKSTVNRMVQQQRHSIFTHSILKEFYFEDGSIPLKIEKLIKSKYGGRALPKELLGDGHTETLNYYVYESLISYIDEVIRNIYGTKN